MRELARVLESRGHTTRLIYLPENGRGWTFVGFSLFLGAQLICATRTPDIVIARSSDGFLCALLSRLFRLKTRVVLHNHGWEEKVYEVEARLPRSELTDPTTWKARLVRFPLIRATLRLAHCCMCGTIGEVRWIRDRYRWSTARLRYLPNGVNMPEGGAESREGSRPDFLLVGGPTWKKNVIYAINLFRRIRACRQDARLFWIGAGEEGGRLLRILGPQSEGVTLVGDVPFDRMPGWYRSCGYLLSTSRFEGGHSLTILEAMSHGMIVFATAIDSTVEVLRDGLNGFALSGCDAGADAALIARCLADAPLLDAVRRRAIASAYRNRWDRQTLRLERMLLALVWGEGTPIGA